MFSGFAQWLGWLIMICAPLAIICEAWRERSIVRVELTDEQFEILRQDVRQAIENGFDEDDDAN